jgi:dihydrolipoamide dehydrogenase
VDLIRGEGKIADKSSVIVSGKKLTAKNILIATGSRPRQLPGFEFDETRVLSSTGAIMMEKLPKKIVILGAGAIGVEFSHILNAFGVEVHLVEMMDRVLPLEDAESSALLERAFKKRGITVSTSTKAASMTKSASGVSVVLEDKTGAKKTMEADQILVVTGRTPNTDGIGLEAVGIKTEKGAIPVGDFYRTRMPGIYAIGDVIQAPLLAHVASKAGEIAVEHIAAELQPARAPKHVPALIDPLSIPSCTYSDPQVASFGLPEWKAREQNRKYEKASFPYRGAGKSVAVEQTEGFIKVLIDPDTKEIIGAHAVGAEATELIHEILLARTAELLPEDIASMIHAHPTLSEAVKGVMQVVEGRAIDI